jgi:hypothetical protein
MKVSADQMRDQIAAVRDCMNSVKSCAKGDDKIAEKRHLANAIGELAVMTLARKNPKLTARQEMWLEQARDLLATSSDGVNDRPDPPVEGVKLVRELLGKCPHCGGTPVSPSSNLCARALMGRQCSA